MKILTIICVMLLVSIDSLYSQISTSTQQVNFSSVLINNTESKTITIQNSSNSDIELGTPRVSGANFEVQSNCTSIVNANSTCNFIISYKPNRPLQDVGEIVIPINSPGYSDLTVRLSGKGAIQYDIKEPINDISVWYNSVTTFFVTASELTDPEFSFLIESDIPVNDVSIDSKTGLFYIKPQLKQFHRFSIVFTAKSGNTTKTQRVHFTILPSLDPELVPIGVDGEVVPDSNVIEYTVFTDYSDPVAKGNLNRIKDSTLSEITIIGKSLRFDRGFDFRKLAEFYSNPNEKLRTNLKELTLIAETIEIETPLFFQQTDVTIICDRLIFRDLNANNPSYISTEPDTLLPVSNAPENNSNGQKGLKAGSVHLTINKLIASNPQIGFTRFYLKGGNGQNVQKAGLIPGEGGDGGDFSCNDSQNSDVFKIVFSGGGFAGRNLTNIRVGDNGQNGTLQIRNNTKNDWIDPSWLNIAIIHLKDAYLEDCNNYTKMMTEKYHSLLTSYVNSAEFKQRNEDEQFELNKNLNDVESVKLRTDMNMDYFGYSPGWVPLLSFEANLSLYQKEIDNSIPILAYTQWASAKTNGLERVINQEQRLISNLASLRDSLESKYSRVNIQIPLVRDTIEIVAKKIESTQNKIDKLLKDLEDQATFKVLSAQKQTEKKNKWRKIASVAGQICAALPVGQPYTTAAGVGLQLASNYNSKDPLGSLFSSYNELNKRDLNKPEQNEFTSDLESILANFNTIKAGMSQVQNLNNYEKVEEIQALYNNNFKSSTPALMNSIMSITNKVKSRFKAAQAPRSAIEAEFQRMVAESPEFKGLSADLENLNNDKQRLVILVNNLIRDILDLNSNLTTIYFATNTAVQVVDNKKAIYNARLGAHLKTVEKDVKDRLLLYNYWLRKSYEYRFLEPYKYEKNPFKWSDALAKIIDESEYQTSIDMMKLEFQNNIQNIAKRVIENVQSGQSLRQTSNFYRLSRKEIDAINKGDTIFFNPVEKGFFPNNLENLRIYNFEFDNVNVIPKEEKPIPQSASLWVDIISSGESIIDKSGYYYKFIHNKFENKNPFLWRLNYDFTAPSGTNPIRVDKLAVSQESLIRSLTGAVNEKLLLYSLPGANANYLLFISKNTKDYEGMLDTTLGKELTIKIEYEYSQTNLKSLNAKIVQPELQPFVFVDRTDVSDKKDSYGSFVRTYNQNQSVGVEVPESYGVWKFHKWNSLDGTTIQDTSNRKLNITLNDSRKLEAIYHGPVISISMLHKDTLYLNTTDTMEVFSSYLDGRKNVNVTNYTSIKQIGVNPNVELKGNLLTFSSVVDIKNDSVVLEYQYVENDVELIDKTVVYVKTIPTSIFEDINQQDKLQFLMVKPNPAGMSIELVHNGVINRDDFIMIYDSKGEIVLRTKWESLSNVQKLQIDKLVPGAYFVNIGKYSTKFIKM